MKKQIWFRSYVSVLDPDDKTRQLTNKQFRHWHLLLALYRKNSAHLPQQTDIGRALNVRPSDVQTILDSFVILGLFDIEKVAGENSYVPHNWDVRQFETDTSTERVKRFRERHLKRNETVSGNRFATSSENIEHRTEVFPPVVPPVPETPEPTSTAPVPPHGGAHTEKQPRKAKTVLTAEQEVWFGKTWPLFWRHEGKEAGRRAFAIHVTTRDTAEAFYRYVTANRPRMLERSAETRPHFSTVVNQERWNDEPDPECTAVALRTPAQANGSNGTLTFYERNRAIRNQLFQQAVMEDIQSGKIQPV